MRREWHVRLSAYVPLILWIGVIFFLSSENGSMARTSQFIRPILTFLFPAASDETLQIYHGYIRKAAHFTEYAGLAFWALRSFTKSFNEIIFKFRYALTLAVVVVIASVDEVNQSFEPSRTSSFRDVLLDVSGGAAMVVVLWLIKRPRPRYRGVGR